MRASRGLAILATLALLLAAPAAHGKLGVRDVSGWGVPRDGFALEGDTLVYFQLEGDAWSLRSRVLPDGEETLLATVAPAQGTRILAVAFDGRWVAWSDDRSGDLEVYAVDVQTQKSHRVTAATGPDVSVSVHDGRVAWVHEPALFWAQLPDGAHASVPVDGLPREPVLVRDGFVLAMLRNETRSMVHLDGQGTEHLLHRQDGSMPRDPRSDGESLAWLTPVLWDADQPGLGVKGIVVQGSASVAGPVVNLTSSPLDVVDLAVGGQRACWLAAKAVHCHDWTSGRDAVHAIDAEALAVSASHVVLLRGVNADLGTIALLDPAASSSIPSAWPAPLALILLAVAALLRRRR